MENRSVISRRRFMGAVGVIAGGTALAPIVAKAQAPPAGKPAEPASTITTPPRDFGPYASPMKYVDPDVITIDPMFVVASQSLYALYVNTQGAAPG